VSALKQDRNTYSRNNSRITDDVRIKGLLWEKFRVGTGWWHAEEKKCEEQNWPISVQIQEEKF
jgi:hypothetical protein